MPSIASSGIEAESIVVLYEAPSGAIVHVRHVVTAKGGKHPDEKEIERAALAELAPGHPREVIPLFVPVDVFASGRLVRVDPERRTLIELPTQPPRQREHGTR